MATASTYGTCVNVVTCKTLDLGVEQQMVLELRPAHDPVKAYGFVGVVVSLKDLSSSIWLWHRDDRGNWGVQKVIEIPAEPADPEQLPPILKGFKAVPPLVSDINLSVDDRFLYVSCWGTGEFQQYDVSDPFHPKLTGSVHLGGIVRRAAHPAKTQVPLGGGPQMVEVSRDGRRIYFTNSLYVPWDEQFYPGGVGSWMAKLDARPEGGMSIDAGFSLTSAICVVTRSAWREETLRQIHTATRKPRASVGLDGAVFFGRISRNQSGNGLAVRGRAWNAETERRRRVAIVVADRRRACDRNRSSSRGRDRSWLCCPGNLHQDFRRLRTARIRDLQALAPRASTLGRHADRLQGFDDLVIPDGLRPRRGFYVGACHDERVQCAQPCAEGDSADNVRSVDGGSCGGYSYSGILTRNRRSGLHGV